MTNKRRVLEKFKDFKNAYQRLTESLEVEVTNDVIIDGVIQRFEFTFELSWKLMKAYLEYEGLKNLNSPRSTIRAAFKNKLIEDGDKWVGMLLDRNKTSHIYDEDKAREIYDKIKTEHIDRFKNLLDVMENVF